MEKGKKWHSESSAWCVCGSVHVTHPPARSGLVQKTDTDTHSRTARNHSSPYLIIITTKSSSDVANETEDLPPLSEARSRSYYVITILLEMPRSGAGVRIAEAAPVLRRGANASEKVEELAERRERNVNRYKIAINSDVTCYDFFLLAA